MSLGLVGRKVGMTRLFTDTGESVPVTVLDVSGNRVTQIKTEQSDGYSAVQIAFGTRRASRINKAQAGHFAKAGVEGARGLREFRVDSEQASSLELGGQLGVDLFEVGQFVDISGSTKGKGFAGAIKRHNFSSQRASHGQSITHNAHGSTGQNQDPGRVFPGKRMAGQLGTVRRTVQNLQVVRIDPERSLLLIRGPVPGADGTDVVVLPSVKKKG
jgi:large subunit ribosomal protein L3